MFFRCAKRKSPASRDRVVARDGTRWRRSAIILIDTRVSQTERKRALFVGQFFRFSFATELAPLVRDWLTRALERAPRRFLRRPDRLNNCVLQRPRERLARTLGHGSKEELSKGETPEKRTYKRDNRTGRIAQFFGRSRFTKIDRLVRSRLLESRFTTPISVMIFNVSAILHTWLLCL